VLFVANIEIMKISKNSKVLIILFTSDFYKYYYGLNLASTYKATNKNVTLFYTGYSVNFLSKNWNNYDKKNINKKLKKKQMPDYLEILKLCSELEINFVFCKTALEFISLNEDDIVDDINITSAPLYQIINEYKNEQTIFI